MGGYNGRVQWRVISENIERNTSKQVYFLFIFMWFESIRRQNGLNKRTLILCRALHNPGKVMTSLNFQFGHRKDLETHL